MTDKPARNQFAIKEAILGAARHSDLYMFRTMFDELDTYRARYDAWRAEQPKVEAFYMQYRVLESDDDFESPGDAVARMYRMREEGTGVPVRIEVDGQVWKTGDELRDLMDQYEKQQYPLSGSRP